jgi:hypothetical protein
MLILPSEDFYADPQSTVDRVTAFLGLPACRLRSHTRHNYHPAADMRPETRRRLRAQFAEHDRDLAKLLGLRLGWA